MESIAQESRLASRLRRQQAGVWSRTHRGGRGGFILETLVQTGTAGDNGTAGETLNQPVLGFLVGLNPLWAATSSGNI